ncbi:DUF6297 family protein [Actinomadura sp. ATCC 31491]|uniref:DUF6297 family protein n=1 Tax=Actinomadura luzonensis TaxID=2805427 RepID=A0ABT0G5P6_9ACTN|nr:DUF6297 family protein [Actinomadura luzonensis]MCK2219895.1 DUF6297 family protein [Actinomadura luzonensis]
MTSLDRYVTGFCLLMFAAVAGQPVSELVTGLAAHADPGRMGAGAALLALGLAGFLAAARAAGPVLVSGPDASWLLLSPLDRRQVLGRTVRALLMVAVAAGLVLGLGLLAVLGAPDQLVWRLLGALAAGVAASVGAMALAVLSRVSQSWQACLTVAVVALLVLAVAAVAGQARTVLAVAAGAPLGAMAAAAAGAVAAAALLAGRAWAALGRVPAREVVAASTRGGHVASAAMGVDPGTFTWIAEDNHWRARKLRSRRWPSMPAPLALAWQDWRRLARRPGRLAFTLATAVLPAVLAGAGAAPGPLAVAVLGGGLAVAASAATGARRDADNPALARLIGVGHRPALAARALLPALLSAVWTTAALVALTTLPTPAGAAGQTIGSPAAQTTSSPAVGRTTGSSGGQMIGSSAAGRTIGSPAVAASSAMSGTTGSADPGVGGPVGAARPGVGGLGRDAGPGVGGLGRAAGPAVSGPGGAAGPGSGRVVGGLVDGVGSGVGGASVSGLWWLFGVAVAPALAAGALRMARRRPVDHSLPVIETGAGAVPLGPVLWAVAGVDLALAGCLPALLALTSAPSHPAGYLVAQAVLGAGVLAAYVLRAGKKAGQGL